MTSDPGFEPFYEKEVGRVFSAVFLLCRNRAVAEDATQEAFARALERWDRLSEAPWAGAWVTTTALNLARRSLRRRLVGTMTPDPPPADETVALWSAVARLPRRQQEAVILHYRMGIPAHEISEVMGCQPGTVRMHLAHARAALREALKEDESHGP